MKLPPLLHYYLLKLLSVNQLMSGFMNNYIHNTHMMDVVCMHTIIPSPEVSLLKLGFTPCVKLVLFTHISTEHWYLF